MAVIVQITFDKCHFNLRFLFYFYLLNLYVLLSHTDLWFGVILFHLQSSRLDFNYNIITILL